MLVVGPSGAGKSTLAARLLLDGADVQGDESVLVRREASLAVPRAVHLKPGYERWLPELAPVAGRPARGGRGHGARPGPARTTRGVSAMAPVDHVVLLDGAAGLRRRAGHVRARRRRRVLEALLGDAFPLTETKAGMVAVARRRDCAAPADTGSRRDHLASMVDALRVAVR